MNLAAHEVLGDLVVGLLGQLLAIDLELFPGFLLPRFDLLRRQGRAQLTDERFVQDGEIALQRLFIPRLAACLRCALLVTARFTSGDHARLEGAADLLQARARSLEPFGQSRSLLRGLFRAERIYFRDS